MNPLILKGNYASLKEGYPVFINTDDIRAFTVLSTSDGIPFGSLLVRTANTKVYEAAQNLAADTIDEAIDIVGVAMATNVKLNVTFPGGTGTLVEYEGGVQGDAMTKGEIAVPYVGTEPDENDKVYLVTNEGTDETAELGRVTADSSLTDATLLELPQFRFSGISDESGLTVLKKLY
jgi:hypothetical protein